MKPLTLWDLYSRKDIHSIFSPDTTFTPQAGTWGLHGIVKIPDRDNDFVFIVTYGQAQGDHEFDEGITSDGVLSWQSQPRQGLNNKDIQKLIKHNDLTDNIYLFLRETARADYQYLGRLAYLEHDVTRENPVYFQWQLLDWDESDKVDIAESTQAVIPTTPKLETKKNLRHTDKRPTKKRQGTDRESFRARKSPDYATNDAKNRQLGLDGECLVLEYERARLIGLGLANLSKNIIHTSVIEGDGAGYDIKSFNEDGSPRYIEVKATRGSLNTDFYMSPNEIKFAKQHSANFVLYRVFNVYNENGDPEFYSIGGDVMDYYEATPVSYRMSFKSDARSRDQRA